MSLTSVEQAIYKRIKAQSSLILGDPELRQQLTGTPVDEIAQGINGLSRKGLILIKKAGNRILYQAVSKEEAKRTGTFEHDEGLVYSHIKDAGNMGAWTRPLKLATNLHQTSFNKAIKGLESKMAIKLVKSVKWPTRKIYMLANLTPSVELTGGPWYSDGGLDQAFIDGLLTVCLNYVKKLTFPRKPPKSIDISDEIYVPNPVFPPSHTKRLPSPHKILEFIVSSGISQQTLAVEHVMQLMNVLVYNGEVEILKPPAGTKHEEGWNSDLEGDGGGMGDKEWKDEVVRRKSREKERERERGKVGGKKRLRSVASDSEAEEKTKGKSKSKSKARSKSKTTDSDATSASESDASTSRNRSASPSSASSAASDTDSDSEKARARKRRKREKEREREKKRAREKEKRRRKKEKERRAREREREREKEKRRRRKEKEKKEKKRKAREKEKRRSKSRTAGSDSDSDSDVLMSIGDQKKKKRSASKKRHGSSSDSDSSSSLSSSTSGTDSSFLSSSDSDSDSDAGSKSKSKSSKSDGKSVVPSAADGSVEAPMMSMYDYEHDIYHDTDVVYRAVHPPASNIEWKVTEAPCVQCPVHLFCSETGPVNPAGCVYYDNWLAMEYV